VRLQKPKRGAKRSSTGTPKAKRAAKGQAASSKKSKAAAAAEQDSDDEPAAFEEEAGSDSEQEGGGSKRKKQKQAPSSSKKPAAAAAAAAAPASPKKGKAKKPAAEAAGKQEEAGECCTAVVGGCRRAVQREARASHVTGAGSQLRPAVLVSLQPSPGYLSLQLQHRAMLSALNVLLRSAAHASATHTPSGRHSASFCVVFVLWK
jgi:hypothetical protein